MKQATLTGKQAKKILEVFEDTSSDQVQAVLESGLLADLREANIAGINRDEFRHVCGLEPLTLNTIITINRSQPFNPAQFLGKGWRIWRGPADGDGLSGAENQDERSLALTELDLSQIQLVTCLKDREDSITGEEVLKRLKEFNHIPLDAQIFQTLWENQYLIPKSWKKKTNGNTTHVSFDGTPLCSPDGDRGVLYFYWREGEWDLDYFWLGDDRFVDNPSAVLTS